MPLLSRYLMKHAAFTTLIIAAVLTLIIWLTQSLRLLDLIINGGAPMGIFASMLLLTVPKFFEIILPIALALGIVYSLNRFSADSELVVMQNSGLSPAKLGSGLVLFACLTAMFVFFLSGWITPFANGELSHLRDVVKSDYSVGLLRPGIFNTLGSDTTIYIAERSDLQNLRGIFVHLKKEGEIPTTLTADRGGLVVKNGKPFVVMFNGTRQQFNPKTGFVDTLRFERYSLNLSLLLARTGEKPFDPDEATLPALLQFDARTLEAPYQAELRSEIHDRLSRPLLTLAFAALAFVPYLTGRFNRRGNAARVLGIIIVLVVLQSAHLGLAYLAGKSQYGFILTYVVPLGVVLMFSRHLFQQRMNAPRHYTPDGLSGVPS
jgi:lipopolysaccharide export system permease protein